MTKTNPDLNKFNIKLITLSTLRTKFAAFFYFRTNPDDKKIKN